MIDRKSKDPMKLNIDLIGCDHVDIGELKYARLLEATTAIVIELLFSGHDPHTVLNLIQPEARPIF